MFIFLDTETTGNGPADRLCQIAFKIKGGYTVNELFNPGMPITIDAMTVHHITNEMVLDKPAFRNSDTWNKLQDLIKSDDANVQGGKCWSVAVIHRTSGTLSLKYESIAFARMGNTERPLMRQVCLSESIRSTQCTLYFPVRTRFLCESANHKILSIADYV
jgi:hypothetical protein